MTLFLQHVIKTLIWPVPRIATAILPTGSVVGSFGNKITWFHKWHDCFVPTFFRTGHSVQNQRLSQKFRDSLFLFGYLMEQVFVLKMLRGFILLLTTSFLLRKLLILPGPCGRRRAARHINGGLGRRGRRTKTLRHARMTFGRHGTSAFEAVQIIAGLVNDSLFTQWKLWQACFLFH